MVGAKRRGSPISQNEGFAPYSSYEGQEDRNGKGIMRIVNRPQSAAEVVGRDPK